MWNRATRPVLLGIILIGVILVGILPSCAKENTKVNFEEYGVIPNPSIPPIDAAAPAKTETATYAMGCFWGPDSLFGSLDGVIRTRVGYAGGTTESPTYHNIGDHTETIQIDYNPAKISYEQLLEIYWDNHNPAVQPW